ncbi:sensor histidine kinase [Nocardioides jiangxiensis]|uniref:histidine kinase n=1 Tax=Nocardioides jiangxiensis TaxID=3064524 RepID=A0ABT9AWU5_9ACTN|nr:sensor histidine kinase [Nocardioides sp. WY-20]MDO7866966.1 sensor histidine kinase [Nocardioides sp. WY-20]
MARPRRDSSVARQILLLQLLLVTALVAAALGLAAYDARGDVRAQARQDALAVALTVADSPAVLAALRSPDPSQALQPYAEEVRRDTATDFVVVMGLDRTRYTHPDPAQIGRKFVGDLGTAPEGTPFTQQYKGTLGPSVRAVVPVMDGDRVVALVSCGITLDRIHHQLVGALLPLGIAGAVVLLAGAGGAFLVNRRLRRQTHGMGADEITRMYEYYDAVLHAVREGLVLVDTHDRVQLVNDEARRLLGLPDEVAGRSIHELGLPPGLSTAAVDDSAAADDIYVTDRNVLVVSSSPAVWRGRTVGSVVSLRDRTELQDVAGELDLVRGLTDSLRAQNHEAANRLHAVVSLIEMGQPEEAVDFAIGELQVAQLLTDRMTASIEEPVLAALLLGKSAEAAERGVALEVEGRLVVADLPLTPRELLTLVGNLVDNALDAAAGSDVRRVRVAFEHTADRLEVVVDDSGPGVSAADADRILERGWSSKAASGRGVGLALVAQLVRRHGGSVSVESAPLGGARFRVTFPLEQP